MLGRVRPSVHFSPVSGTIWSNPNLAYGYFGLLIEITKTGKDCILYCVVDTDILSSFFLNWKLYKSFHKILIMYNTTLE